MFSKTGNKLGDGIQFNMLRRMPVLSDVKTEILLTMLVVIFVMDLTFYFYVHCLSSDCEVRSP